MSGLPAPPEPGQRRNAAPAITRALRLPLLIVAVATLVAATAAGLQRIGYLLGVGDNLAGLHGPLIVCGVFGTLISLERAVALGQGWAYGAPIAAASGSLAGLLGAPAIAAVPWVGAALLLTAVSAAAMRRVVAPFTAVLVVGAACWAIGAAILAAGHAIEQAVPWWIAFFVLTIAAERLELSRFVPQRRGQTLLLIAIVAALLLGTLLTARDEAGWRLAGASLVALSIWLVRHDVARRTILHAGLPRYVAVCLSSGYVWLAAGGAIMLLLSVTGDRLAYDAALHAIFLGFVFSMVFGHAPIILPAVARMNVAFSRLFYAPLVLLHVSVAVRIGADLGTWPETRRISGALSAAALALFAATIVTAMRRARQARQHRAAA